MNSTSGYESQLSYEETRKPSLEVATTTLTQITRQTQKIRAAVTYYSFKFRSDFSSTVPLSRLITCTHTRKCFLLPRSWPFTYDLDLRAWPR